VFCQTRQKVDIAYYQKYGISLEEERQNFNHVCYLFEFPDFCWKYIHSTWRINQKSAGEPDWGRLTSFFHELIIDGKFR
jgi:hypothetical protein